MKFCENYASPTSANEEEIFTMSEKLNSVQSNRKSTPQQLYEAVLKNDLSLVKKLPKNANSSEE